MATSGVGTRTNPIVVPVPAGPTPRLDDFYSSTAGKVTLGIGALTIGGISAVTIAKVLNGTATTPWKIAAGLSALAGIALLASACTDPGPSRPRRYDPPTSGGDDGVIYEPYPKYYDPGPKVIYEPYPDPVYVPPAYEDPIYEPYPDPVYVPPAYEDPIYEPDPVYIPPVYDDPVYEPDPPSYDPPSYDPPSYDPPSYDDSSGYDNPTFDEPGDDFGYGDDSSDFGNPDFE